jgi:hypothetical protein
MPGLGDIASGATGGFVASGGNPFGALVGAGLSLLGPSASSQRRGQYDFVMNKIGQLRSENEAMRKRTLDAGISRLARFGGSMIGSATSSAAQRDAARGIKDTTASVLTARQAPTTAVSRTMGQFVSGVNDRFDSNLLRLQGAELDATMSYASNPIEPSVGDTLLTVGKGIGDWMNNKSYIGILQGALANKGNNGGTTPNFSGLPWRP